MTEVSSPPEYASTTLSMSPFITFPVVSGQPTPRSIGEGVTATRAVTGMTSPSRCYVHRSAISARADGRDLRDQGGRRSDGSPAPGSIGLRFLCGYSLYRPIVCVRSFRPLGQRR